MQSPEELKRDKPAKYIAQATKEEKAKSGRGNFTPIIEFAEKYIAAEPPFLDSKNEVPNSEFVKVWNSLILCYLAAGQYGRAEASAKDATEIFENEPGLYLAYARVLDEQGKVSELIDLSLETIKKFPDKEKFPNKVIAYNNLAKSLEKIGGRLGEAEKWGKKAIEEFPENLIAGIFMCHLLNKKTLGHLRQKEIEPAQKAAMESYELLMRLKNIKSPAPEQTGKTLTILSKRLAEMHMEANDSGIGVEHPINPAAYDLAVQGMADGAHSDFVLKRNTVSLTIAKPARAKSGDKIKPDTIAVRRSRSGNTEKS